LKFYNQTKESAMHAQHFYPSVSIADVCLHRKLVL